MFAEFFDITGPQVRRVLAAVSTHLGIVYAMLSFVLYLVPSHETGVTYSYQITLLPLWLFALLFFLLGVFTFLTVNVRLTKFGRIVAACGMSVYLLYSLTFIPNFSFTALAVYPLLSLIYLLETFSHK